MKTLISQMRAALLAPLVLLITVCGLYPLLVYGFAQVLFPHNANGSLIRDKNGMVRGSELIAQSFTGEKYFHPRPSAAGNGFDATSSGGSNLGPTSEKLRDAIRERIAQYRSENELPPAEPIPADAVTGSGSGLDPHISPRNAALQAARVARARHLSRDKVLEAIQQATDPRQLGVLGDAGVNVLKLNLALDNSEK